MNFRQHAFWSALLAFGLAAAASAQSRPAPSSSSDTSPSSGWKPVPHAASQPAPSLPVESSERAVVIPIQDEITDITKDSVERRLARVRQEGVRLVIFEFNTPGGALGSTLDITRAIKAARDEGIRSYAWVNNEAYSAGTIIALATDGILMSSNATIGDCQPIMIGSEGPAALPKGIEAKATSPLLAELRDSARRNGYNLDMVLKLIRPEMQMFWLVNTQTGEKRFVETGERDELFGLDSAQTRPAGEGARHEPVPDSLSKTAWRYVKEAPGLSPVRQPIVSDRELLTMRTVEAANYGFSLATANNDSDLKRELRISGAVDRLEKTWIESIVEWLATPTVRGVLFLLMVLGAYAEFQHPGFGVPAIVAVVALVLFLGAPYAAGFTVTWEIIAIVLGLALLALEIFVIPGFGVAGIAGAVLLLVGLIASFVPQEPGFGPMPHWPTMGVSFDYLRNGLWALAAGTTGAIIGMALLAKYMPRVPVAGLMIAPNPTREQVVVDDPYEGAAKLGDIGTSEGPLRPAGKARFGACLVDVVSDGEYIDKGRRVEVVERCGSRVVVRRVD